MSLYRIPVGTRTEITSADDLSKVRDDDVHWRAHCTRVTMAFDALADRDAKYYVFLYDRWLIRVRR